MLRTQTKSSVLGRLRLGDSLLPRVFGARRGDEMMTSEAAMPWPCTRYVLEELSRSSQLEHKRYT